VSYPPPVRSSRVLVEPPIHRGFILRACQSQMCVSHCIVRTLSAMRLL